MTAAPTPLVSVVLPTHNRARLLPRAIRSVLAQSYANLELIVVDDCSTDETPAVVERLACPRLRYLRLDRPHHAAGARNAGIRAARGELIAFQDDDDVWLVDKLDRQVSTLLAGGDDTGLNFCGRIRFLRDAPCYIGGDAALAAMDFARGPLEGFGMVATPAWLVRRRCLDAAGLFDEAIRTWEDWELALRLSRVCGFNQIDEPLYIQDRDTGGALWNDGRLYAASMRRILDKHAALWTARPRELAKLRLLVGRYETIHGSAIEARRWLRAAIAIRPYYPKAWLAYLLSYFGAGPMQIANAAIRRLRSWRKAWT